MTERCALPFVKAIVCREGRLLLQRRRKADRYHAFWELPGGRVRAEESTLEALARELREEAGLELTRVLGQVDFAGVDRFGGRASLLQPLAVVEAPTSEQLVIGHYFACEATGEPSATDEGEQHRWITPPALRRELDEGIDLATLDAVALRSALEKVEALMR